MKEDLEAKTLVGKLKDRVYELSVTLSSTNKSIRELKKTIAAAKKAVYQVTRKSRALKSCLQETPR